MKKYIFTTTLGIAFLSVTGLVAAPLASVQLTDIELLGKYVFFDKISSPSRMACVTCHQPATGGTGGVSGVNLHQVAITGANPHTVGNLKPPTNAYASLIPLFQPCPAGIPGLCGGNFWNGRAEGRGPGDVPAGALFPGGATKHIGDEIFYTTNGTLLGGVSGYDTYFGPTADQALNPMPNLVEQNIDRQAVCKHVANAKYAPLYKLVWGVDIDCSDTPVAKSALDVDPIVDGPEKAFDISFKRIMLAVCAWQDSTDLNSFSSKRDIALQRELDGTDVDATPGAFPLVGLTVQENRGHDLFYNTILNPNPSLPITNCAFCHSERPGVDTGVEPDQLYSDFAYHLIGVPANPEIPGYPVLNLGLAGHTGPVITPFGLIVPEGFHKTTTLRNVDKRTGKGFIKAYTHNGWFKSLESIVHFYNTGAIGRATANSFGITRCQGDMTEKQALKQNCWPAPEFEGFGLALAPIIIPTPGGPIIIPPLIGDMGLTPDDEAAIVAYMKTFTDTYTPKQPNPYK